MSILDNQLMIRAVEKIALRAEYRDTHNNIYIDTGQLSKLTGDDNQIIYGRRGTGKTHLLQAYQGIVKPGVLSVYIDLRKTQDAPLRPTGDPEIVSLTSLKCFQQIILLLTESYQDYLDGLIKSSEYTARRTPDEILELLARLVDLSKGEWYPTELLEHSDEKSHEVTDSSSNGINVKTVLSKTPSLELGFSNTDTTQSKGSSATNIKVKGELRLPFTKIISTLEEINDSLSLNRTVLLLDEWSSLALDLQPYLAEWIKRSFMSSPNFTIKVACIRYRSNFSFNSQATKIGFEVGGDIFVGVDLDDILVFDKNKSTVSYFFARLLYNHLTEAHSILANPEDSQSRFVNDIFSERRAFEELIKASEGIPRDFLYIFTSSFRKAQEHPQWKSVGVPAIVDAAKDFYHRDKMTEAKPELQEIMEILVREVIKHRKVKAFLVPQRLSGSITLQELMTARLLHRWHIGYAAKSGEVGERFDIYAIDYGAYVDLRETSIGRELNESMFEDDYDYADVPPTIDKRAVRHIVLDEQLLEKFDQILEGAIECPNCHTKFSAKQKSYVIKGLCPNCFEHVPIS
jgi:energy-coupling factor transporter ATP-binding protein EcfA2